MELGPQNHNNGDGLLGPNSIIVVYMDPLGSGNHINSLLYLPLVSREWRNGGTSISTITTVLPFPTNQR